MTDRTVTERTTTDRTPRVRPAFRLVAIVAFAILLPIAAHNLWDYIEVRRLVREIERLQQKGEPVNLREAFGGAAPRAGQERGAASYYMAGGMLALGSQATKVMTPVREWLASSDPDRPPLDRDRIATPLRETVERSRDALQLADAAARLPFTQFPPGTEFSYRTAGIGALSELITARTLTASLAGRGDDAVDSLISGLQIRRALRAERWRSLGGHQADAVLSLSSPSPEALRRLQAALEAEDAPNQALDILLSERARFLESMWRRYYGFDSATPRYVRWRIRSLTETVSRPWFTHRAIETLRVWAALIDITRSPWPPSAEIRAAVTAQYGGGAGTPSSPASPAIAVFTRAIDATELIVDRCSRVAVAVERFRRDRGGALPTDLSQLVPHYLASVPVDPYSRKPLLFRSSPDAYTIYSVGQNEQDDGGDLTSELQRTIDRGWGRRVIRGADVGVRVWVRH